MQTSPQAALRYPDLTDVPNIPTHIQNLATDLDTKHIPKFANTGARDAAITSPTNGQHVYMQDTQNFQVYRSDYGLWLQYNASWLKVKTANETLGNSTTLQDDNHITGIPLKASTPYRIRGTMFVMSPAAADWKCALIFSVAPANGQWGAFNQGAAAVCGATADTITTTLTLSTQGSPNVESIRISGVFTSNVSSGTVKLQWAKLTADAGTTTVFLGSHLEFVEV